MPELGYNTLATTFTGTKTHGKLHCTNPDCYEYISKHTEFSNASNT